MGVPCPECGAHAGPELHGRARQARGQPPGPRQPVPPPEVRPSDREVVEPLRARRRPDDRHRTGGWADQLHGGDRSNVQATDLADLDVEKNLAADAVFLRGVASTVRTAAYRRGQMNDWIPTGISLAALIAASWAARGASHAANATEGLLDAQLQPRIIDVPPRRGLADLNMIRPAVLSCSDPVIAQSRSAGRSKSPTTLASDAARSRFATLAPAWPISGTSCSTSVMVRSRSAGTYPSSTCRPARSHVSRSQCRSAIGRWSVSSGCDKRFTQDAGHWRSATNVLSNAVPDLPTET